MAPWYLTVFAMALICNLVLKAPRPRLSDARAKEVILGGRNGSDGSLPPVFAHRGGRREAPENTLAGIREAKRCNASGVHLDLSFTSDELIYGLRLRNPNIVTALTWRPGFYAYSDKENLKARFESPVKHWIAQALDWIADSAFHCGFTSYATGVLAVLVNRDSLSADYVRAWRDQGIHVIACTSSSSKQNDFLRKVLRVAIITDL
ncbi:hypothetical protein V5799_018421 [Amblyomma americanum]|uniref:GP-PDE domain-containing protein n=1 Tax=Amblyomma americanum TaxID=6943 RepID=A0AAQ4F0H8_AMBAM